VPELVFVNIRKGSYEAEPGMASAAISWRRADGDPDPEGPRPEASSRCTASP
jgi:hypothetical protein